MMPSQPFDIAALPGEYLGDECPRHVFSPSIALDLVPEGRQNVATGASPWFTMKKRQKPRRDDRNDGGVGFMSSLQD